MYIYVVYIQFLLMILNLRISKKSSTFAAVFEETITTTPY